MLNKNNSIIVLIMLYLAFISLGLPDQTLGVAWFDIRHTFVKPLSAAGLLVFIATICTAVASFCSGYFIKRYSIATILITSCLLTASAMLGYALSPQWAVFLCCTIPLGLGAGTIDSVLNNYVAHNYSSRHMNWLHGFWGIGATLGPAIITLALAATSSWRVGYLCIGLLQCCLLLLFICTRKQWLIQVPTKIVAIKQKPKFWSGAAVWSCLFFFVYTGLESSLGLWFYSVLVEQRGVEKMFAGSCLVAYWAALTIGRFLLGVVSHKLSTAKIITWGIRGAFCGVVLLIPNNVVLNLIGLMTVGLSISGIYPCMMHETPVRFSSQQAVVLTGYQVGMASLGVACIPPLVGLFISATTLNYLAPLLGIFVLGLLFFDRQLGQ